MVRTAMAHMRQAAMGRAVIDEVPLRVVVGAMLPRSDAMADARRGGVTRAGGTKRGRRSGLKRRW